jgi:hypothetical protein
MQPSDHGIGHAREEFLALNHAIREDYAQHEPMAMFPEPSSTIPNATATQQRVLEGVVAPALLGLDSEIDVPPYQVSIKGSVPWSDMMDFSPVEAREQSEPSDPKPEPDPAEPLPRLSEPTQESITSQRSRRASSVRMRGSPPQHKVLLDSVVPNDIVAIPDKKNPCQISDLSLAASRGSQKYMPTTVGEPSQQQDSKLGSCHNSEDDSVAIELPKDEYKPRPSRSRSLKIDSSEAVDYSIRPERAAKVTKRRKTTTVAVATRSTQVVDLTPTPEKVRQICDMGFTPTSTERALRHHKGDVTQTVDWLISNGMGEDELASHHSPKRRPASKAAHSRRSLTTGDLATSTQLSEDTNSRLESCQPLKPLDAVTGTLTEGTGVGDAVAASAAATTVKVDQLKSPKVQVVIPSKSPKSKSPQKSDSIIPLSKKAKRRKNMLDMPEPESTPETAITPEVITQKRKSRGRPKKVANAILPTVIVEDVPQKTHEEQGNELNGDLPTIERNLTVTITSRPSEKHHAENTQDQMLTPSKLPANSHPPVSTLTAEPSIKPTTHSPASKGKASYRVGLSKRARIAPLLRIVKK